MKFDAIIDKLKKDGYKVEVMNFRFEKCLSVRGTALIDLVNGEIKNTTAEYKEVLEQIWLNKSHILTIDEKDRYLTGYSKLIE